MDIDMVELSKKHSEFKHTFCKRLPEGKVYASIYKALFPKLYTYYWLFDVSITFQRQAASFKQLGSELDHHIVTT